VPFLHATEGDDNEGDDNEGDEADMDHDLPYVRSHAFGANLVTSKEAKAHKKAVGQDHQP
jgi:hypothetical protein